MVENAIRWFILFMNVSPVDHILSHYNSVIAWSDDFITVLLAVATMLVRENGMSLDTYSTDGMLGSTASNDELTLFLPNFPCARIGTTEVVANWLREIGLEPVRQIELHEFTSLFSDSGVLLRKKPELLKSVSTLARAIHPVVSFGDTDTSHSDPGLPLSIAVSVPNATTSKDAVERLTESLIHEVMHLQLTLCERVVPVVSQPESIYSPWKKEFRDIRGIIHGMYVFGILFHFWSTIDAKEVTANTLSFASRRTNEIRSDFAGLTNVSCSRSLTSSGKTLINTLYCLLKT